jgi:hypothetical protein
VPPTSTVVFNVASLPSSNIKLKFVAPLSPNTPTYWLPSTAQLSNIVFGVLPKLFITVLVATSTSAVRPSFWPLTSATSFSPPRDNA